jgi:hypothetical protein
VMGRSVASESSSVKRENVLLNALEGEAMEQISMIREYRNYQGNNPEYRQRAKIAIGVIGACVRLRATMANEKSNELIERRLLSQEAQEAQPALPAGDSR